MTDGGGWDWRSGGAPEPTVTPPAPEPPAFSPAPGWGSAEHTADGPPAAQQRGEVGPDTMVPPSAGADDSEDAVAQIWRESRQEATGRSPRSVRPRRLPGGGVLAVFGLLGLLLTMGILGLLASRVLGSVDDDGPGTATSLGAEQEMASFIACAADRETLELAIRTYTLQLGFPPPDVASVVDAGFLTDPPDSYEFRPDELEQVVGVGPCAGS